MRMLKFEKKINFDDMVKKGYDTIVSFDTVY